MDTARGTFEIEMTPGSPGLEGAVDRFDFTKTFRGDLAAAGTGMMLACGNPHSGEAGYVAIETVTGDLGGRSGSFALGQLGVMHEGSQTLHYVIVPGSGDGELSGITGIFHLTIDEDGTHRYDIDYALTD